MNLRESPAVKNKIKDAVITASVVLILCFPFMGLMFVKDNKFLVIFGIIFLLLVFYNIYKFLKFYGLLKKIETGQCIILAGKGYFSVRGSGNNRYHMLEVMVTNSDGTTKMYESDKFFGKLGRKYTAIKAPAFFKPFFGTANEELFNKASAEDFTVYVDPKNPKNYFVDISPLYMAAEQKLG
ncbi:MAG: hypothetical protein LBI01_00440 [Elusimicrobium sp.]|jgi:hypothetical protein|nr:hypothetical protein [Elusimicrobium sp.]